MNSISINPDFTARLPTIPLKSENIRINAELDIARQLQKMLLPTDLELNQIQELEIAGFMEPAEQVGGD